MMSNARRYRLAPRVALLALAGALSACGATFGQMPEKLGGLPESAPQRPAETMPFPNVYEPRPVRAAKPLTDEEQKKLESDLATLRENQKQRANPLPQKAIAAPAKKPPAPAAANSIKAAAKATAAKATAAKTAAPAKKKQDEAVVPEQKGPVAPPKLIN